MQATKFEFAQRFWIIGFIFGASFFLSNFDHVSMIAASRHALAPTLIADTPAAVRFGDRVIAAGATLVFLAAILRTWATAYLHTDVVHDTSEHAEALVADGPYRFTRNPLYLANLPMAAGLGVLASRLGFVFVIAANWIFVYRLIFREEAILRETQGQSYRAYSRAVPRFWPSLMPRVAASGRAPRWGQALAGESFIWAFGAAEICLAFSRNLILISIISSAGMAIHLGMRYRASHQARAA